MKLAKINLACKVKHTVYTGISNNRGSVSLARNVIVDVRLSGVNIVTVKLLYETLEACAVLNFSFDVLE